MQGDESRLVGTTIPLASLAQEVILNPSFLRVNSVKNLGRGVTPYLTAAPPQTLRFAQDRTDFVATLDPVGALRLRLSGLPFFSSLLGGRAHEQRPAMYVNLGSLDTVQNPHV